MPQQIDFIIYVEHRVRELDAAVLLFKYLKGMGLCGTIAPTHYNVRMNVLKYKPDIVIVPQCYSEKNDIFKLYEELYGKSFERVNLHQEQITDKSGLEFMMPSDDYSKKLNHICWGEAFAKQLVKYGVDSEKVFITGSPRTDLIINRNDNNFRDMVSKEFNIDKDKKWLLIPMNFSLVFVDEEYLKGIEASGGKNVRQRVEITKKSMYAFFDILNECADELKDYEIILRPHPYEDPNNYNEFLNKMNKYGNVHLIRKYSVGDWIYESFKVINWSSTSALEAVMAKKPVANLQPLEIGRDFEMDYFKYLPLLKDKRELLKFIENEGEENGKISEFIKDTFYKLDGMSCQRVSAAIGYVLSHSSVEFEYKLNIPSLMKFGALSVVKDVPKMILYKLGILEKISKRFKALKEDYISSKDIPKEAVNKNIRIAARKCEYGIEVEA